MNKYLIVFVFISCQLYAQHSPQRWNSGGKLNPLQANMDIRHYTLSLNVNIPEQRIEGFVETELILIQPADTILFDLIDRYNVKKIWVDNRPAAFLRKNDHIFIIGRIQSGRHKTKIEYEGNPPVAVRPPWLGGFTWSHDKTGKPWVVINCQLDGAKIYFPCKDHPSDEPNEGVDLFITVPKGLTVAAPGLLQGTSSKGEKTTFHWKTNYTISNYCVVFNIADYQVVRQTYTTILNNHVPMEFYVLKQDVNQAQQVLNIRARDTHILEKYFGEYPWAKEKIGIAQVPNPGMEHQTMITYGDPFTYQQFNGQYYSANLFHEFTHEWWANKVTNKDWAHMWIQEGITTYAEALCLRELTGEKGYDSMMLNFKNSIQNKKPLVQGEEVNSQDTYTGDVYVKGAFLMHTLRYVLGDAVFFPALKKLAVDPNYTYDHFVTTNDVEQLFSREAKTDLKPLFDFYTKTTDRLEIGVTQTGVNTWKISPKNLPMKLPFEIRSDKGEIKTELFNQSVKIESTTFPVIDPGNHYLTRIVVE
ncbi:MAG: hypothetical protein OJF59_001161 [Cytophagales bacterium]|jgi:aminopeptidase N|nr:M1 family metallopeptidase [Bacteroidota bacterium]MBS1981791.1 M1 family metallopeptidase [Bacteroidota bacterium]WHZ07408.1 MAG: hypothetical protein OJF59_001161 [Cytophagales bacterium]